MWCTATWHISVAGASVCLLCLVDCCVVATTASNNDDCHCFHCCCCCHCCCNCCCWKTKATGVTDATHCCCCCCCYCSVEQKKALNHMMLKSGDFFKFPLAMSISELWCSFKAGMVIIGTNRSTQSKGGPQKSHIVLTMTKEDKKEWEDAAVSYSIKKKTITTS